MKRSLMIFWAVCIFSIGFIIGQHKDIPRIIAQELTSSTPTPIKSGPTPTYTPTPTPIQYVSTPESGNATQLKALPTAGGGPRNDIVEDQHITASKLVAQVGDDINFIVTIRNQAPYDKLIKQLCFNSSDGNFGCTQDFNLYRGQTFNFNNSGRFISGGVKTVWITWTQDGQNFYRPVDGGMVKVIIQQ